MSTKENNSRIKANEIMANAIDNYYNIKRINDEIRKLFENKEIAKATLLIRREFNSILMQIYNEQGKKVFDSADTLFKHP